MNPVLSEIVATRKSLNRDGTGTIDIHSNISPDEGEMLGRLIRSREPRISLEVGLAFGVSALFICDALKESGENVRHIVIDPAQNAPAYWQGVGLANLRRAGFAEMLEFIEKPSQIALPELVAAGRKVDFAFVDGEHTFDHVLVDFFFIDQLLNVGGVVVLDDAAWPSIRRVARFVASNRSYKVIDQVGRDDRPDSRLARHTTPATQELDERLGLWGSCIAFEKIADDSRQCDFYVDF